MAKVTADMACKVIARCASVDQVPEKKLWLAVILQAVRESVFNQYKINCQAFFSGSHFDTVCNYVDLDPEATREIIQKIGKNVDI